MCIDPLRGYIKLLWELHVGMLHMYVNVWLAVSVCSPGSTLCPWIKRFEFVCFYSKMETILEILELDKILVYLCICMTFFYCVSKNKIAEHWQKQNDKSSSESLIFLYWLMIILSRCFDTSNKSDSICMFLFGLFAFCLKHLNNVHLTKNKYWERIHVLLKILSKS